jgi:hypothetical protein
MGEIKIQITELTIPNDFKIYYKAGADVMVGLSSGINPYPMSNDDPIVDGFTDYGPIFTGGTSTIDLIGDFVYGQVYWIKAKEINYPERWMVKNIKINDGVIYQSFLNITPTPTPTKSVTPTPISSITPSRTPLRTPTVTQSITPTSSFVPSPSKTPSRTPTKSRTPSISITPSRTPTPSPTIFGYGVTIYNCNGSLCSSSIGYAPIQTTVFLTVGKFYTINDPGGDVIRVDSIQFIGGSSIIVGNGPFDTCNDACASF